MRVQVRRPNLFGKGIVTLVAVFALVAQPLYGFVESQIASALPVQNGHTWEVGTAADFKAALSDDNINHITLTSSFSTTESFILSRSNVTINGAGKTITGPNLGGSWVPGGDNYGLKIYKASGIKINSLRVTGANVGIQLNGSEVELRGHTNVSGNVFGGIELSKGSGVTTTPKLVHKQGSIINSTESYAKPTIWAVGSDYSVQVGSATGETTTSSVVAATHIVAGQTQYYLQPSNAGSVTTNVAYVSTTGSDANGGGSLADAYATIQKGLDSIGENGTVYVADGSYYGTAAIKKSGTKLIGITNNRDTVKIYATPSSGQAGIFANGLNNVTIKNLGVYGDDFGSTGALIKLYNGANARIENVVVKNASSSGININSYKDVVITGVYVSGVAKDGISVVAKQNGSILPSVVSQNITIQNSTISKAGWSAIAFYTTSSSISENIEGVTISNVRTQYGDRGLYVEGKTGKTVTSPSQSKLILNGVTFGQNNNEYINNEQGADIDARSIKINIGGGVEVAASDLTQVQYDAVLGKIKDKTHKNPTGEDYGHVYFATLRAPVLTNSPVYVSASEPYDYATWTYDGVGVDHFEYREYLSLEEANADVDGNTASYWKPTTSAIVHQQQVGHSWTGEKTLYYRVVAIDAAGNRSVPSARGVVIIDKVAPTATINPVIANSTNTPTISGTSEPGAKVDIYVNGALYDGDVVVDADGNWEYVFTSPLADGAIIKVIARDSAGNPTADTKAPTAVYRSYVVSSQPGRVSIPAPSTPLRSIATTAATIPAAITPAALFFGNADDATVENEREVLGAQSSNTKNDDTSAVESNVAAIPTAQGWKLFGLLWYWWALIIAGVAGIWWMIAAARRKSEENN